jgi:hypothetical protein
MADESNRRPGAPIRAVVLEAGEWSSGPLLIARTARQRRRGVRPAVGPFGAMLATRSIHGWGLGAPLRWLGLDRSGTVVAVGVLHPRRLIQAPQPVRWIVETPEWITPAPIGERARVVPILAAWPDD